MQHFRFALLITFLGVVSTAKVWAQEENEARTAPPPINTFRAEEDYSYLSPTSINPYASSFGDALKYISLDTGGNVYMRIGAQYRTRWDHFTNDNWTSENDSYYSQRLALHTSIHIGQALRLFGEVYHGFTSNGDRLFQDDEIDMHQGFVEWIPIETGNLSLSIRVGRQELSLGASRLIGIRDGPNIRRSFDLSRISFQNGRKSIDLLYGQEVNPKFGAFDNVSRIFGEDRDQNPRIWSVYVQRPTPTLNGLFETYYIGFQSSNSTFSDVSGRETRHSLGARSSGNLGNVFSYNTELIYQFGRLSGNSINAVNFETDWTYTFKTSTWKPALGLKLDWSTGDAALDDDEINTFNPLFVNPAIYSLAGVNTPANLTSFHPNLTIYPADGLVVYVEYAVFYRTRANDGFYSPPRFQTRPAEGNQDKHIGDVVGLRVTWNIHRNVSFALMSSYFAAGSFIKSSGPSNDIFYVSPTLNFRF